MTHTTNEPLTLEQKIKFDILVPLVSDMVIKHQREVGSLTKADSSERYNKAVAQITAHLLAVVEEAEKRGELAGRSDELVRLSEWGKAIDDQWNGHFEERLAVLVTSKKIKDGDE